MDAGSAKMDAASLERLPDEKLLEIALHSNVYDASRFCQQNRRFRKLCEDNKVLEKLAKIEVERIAPYSFSCGSYLDTLRLIRNGQTTMYTLLRPEVRAEEEDEIEYMRMYPSTENGDIVEEDSSDVNVFLPGLLRESGRYWIIGMKEYWIFPGGWKLFRTQKELDQIIRESGLMEDDVYKEAMTEFLRQFEESGGMDGSGLQLVIGPEDSDQGELYLRRVIVQYDYVWRQRRE